ncbi:MAG TPA: malto-oligosyltrehalose synthase [Roseiarcus sp.]|nr:malto-oligosyltrehalose synthase [Roseiarcus sp.]
MTAPRATYRLQFHAGFTFRQAAAIAPYLGRLGVSHVYASPYLKARPGSAHGYDITDHNALNPEVGSEDDHAAMIESFKREGLGLILDFVPNHMGVGGADNPFWLDVLEWGPDSNYAGWFDIDWAPDDPYLGDKLLAPFLGDQYGVELKAGKLALKYDAEEGAFAIWAYDNHKLPICPLHYGLIVGAETPGLERLGDLFGDLRQWRPQIAERAKALKAELAAHIRADEQARDALAARIAAFNADWRALDGLIAKQNWRIAYYGVASDEINYRRFFNINELAGLRVELPALFRRMHDRVLAMLDQGAADGLRLDHVDGLFDPKAYFAALRKAASRPFYLAVEKILAPHEQLREEWPVDGTTGYDYANLSLGVLINPAAEESFSQTYRDFAGAAGPFDEIARACKLRIMDNEMASELNALSRAAVRLAHQNPMTADFSRNILRRAIRQIVASLPVYRTYIDMSGAPSEADLRDLDWAVAQARREDPDIHPSAFAFLRAALSGALVAEPNSGYSRTACLRFAMKLQQYSGPVMAKGVEDTAFYRYNRHIALNEVGGAPERFGVSINAFHKANAVRAKNWPRAMLATSTHDTKRGEDGRARLAVLSDIPEEWRREVDAWSRIIRARRGDVERQAAPDRNDEYMFYQLLIGSWPPELMAELDDGALQEYRRRVLGALQKSLREAKLHTSWTAPNPDYEEAMRSFALDALDPSRSGFLANFLPFVRRVARLGVDNSLAQTAMKLTLPGVADIYQGSELWNFSLVDPDNRRAVDYEIRAAALAALLPRLAKIESRGEVFADLLANWPDGRIKLAATALLLGLRREKEQLFVKGGYEPVAVGSERAFGYIRSEGGDRVASLIARFPGLRQAEPDFGGATADLPEGPWIDELTGRRLKGGQVGLSQVFAVLPIAVLRQG